jgi:two-component system, OmpR family, KDP operon response regulator KdpE
MTTLAVISDRESLAVELRAQFDAVCVSPSPRPYFRDGVLPDAFVLDVGGGDSTELVAYLASTTQRPIVVLGGEMRPNLVSAYLESGADAVVPFTGCLDECVARLRALTRRSTGDDNSYEAVYRAGDVAVYPESRRVLVKGTPARLTRTEFNLLTALAQRLDEVVPHRQLMSEVWGPEYISARHYLRVYIRRLREKIEANPDHPVLLVAQRGKGYMLRALPEAHGSPEVRAFT